MTRTAGLLDIWLRFTRCERNSEDQEDGELKLGSRGAGKRGKRARQIGAKLLEWS
jgi:hypothetical protein